jgi:hypothetical protein
MQGKNGRALTENTINTVGRIIVLLDLVTLLSLLPRVSLQRPAMDFSDERSKTQEMCGRKQPAIELWS